MNQGKLDVVKQEMARMNIDILGISELKWTGMGKLNSDDNRIYYCGQESHRRNGAVLIINKSLKCSTLGCKLKNDRMISVHFQDKPFNIRVIQLYAPMDVEEVDQLNKDLQDLLELTPQDVLFNKGDWNAKVGSQDTWSNRQVWPWCTNEAGQRLTEFCQEKTLVKANTLFQQNKGLYTWTSLSISNQTDYILWSRRWKNCIQSAKTRPGVDCASGHQLLIAKFTLKLKKVGKNH